MGRHHQEHLPLRAGVADVVEEAPAPGAVEASRNTPVPLHLRTFSRAASLSMRRSARRVMPATCAAFWKRMAPTCCNQPTR